MPEGYLLDVRMNFPVLYITPGYIQRLSRINVAVGKVKNVEATTFTRFE